jgi:hypothetical protein
VRPPGYVRPLSSASEVLMTGKQVRALVACPPPHLDGCGAKAGKPCVGLAAGSMNHLARVQAARRLVQARRLGPA